MVVDIGNQSLTVSEGLGLAEECTNAIYAARPVGKLIWLLIILTQLFQFLDGLASIILLSLCIVRLIIYNLYARTVIKKKQNKNKMLERYKNQIRDIYQGFLWAYMPFKNKWYRNAIAHSRLSRCLVCSKRNHNKCSECGCYLIPKAYSCTPTNDCPLGFWLPLFFDPKDKMAARFSLSKKEYVNLIEIVNKHKKDGTLIRCVIEFELRSALLTKDNCKADLIKLESCLKLFNNKIIQNEQFSEIGKKRKRVTRRFASLFRGKKA